MNETCLCCGSPEHTAKDCPQYDEHDRELLLLGATLFVNVMLENMSFGQNLLWDFEQRLGLLQEDEYVAEDPIRDLINRGDEALVDDLPS